MHRRVVGHADHRGRESRPPGLEVSRHPVMQLVEIRLVEAAPIARLVEIARRGAEHHQAVERLRLRHRGCRADHPTDGMTDVNAMLDVEFRKHLQEIVRKAKERVMAVKVVAGLAARARSGKVEGGYAETFIEPWPDRRPGALVGSEDMR